MLCWLLEFGAHGSAWEGWDRQRDLTILLKLKLKKKIEIKK